VIFAATLTAGLLVWRFAKATPPHRRALAIGTPIALLFLAFQIIFQLLGALDAPESGFSEFVKWGIVGARAALWYGFLAALIAAQLFAAQALQRLVRESLHRPSPRELEAMLREPLGDPQLRLGFWDTRTESWASAEGEDTLELSAPEPGLDLTVVEHRGTPAVAILHDAQLNDDPELLVTAGAVALLAAENAELDAAWQHALQDLRESRTRIIRAGDAERRKVERNLHDGVQQRLTAIRIHLGLASDYGASASEMRHRLEELGDSVEAAIDELRDIGHGLYPPVLSDQGLVAALEQVQRRPGAPLAVQATGIGRHPPELESAIYYCCLEAIQNANKHVGPEVRTTVVLRQDSDELAFHVSDNGPGFDAAQLREGAGLQNMRDRLGALDGHLSIFSAPGRGTTVEGSVPLRDSARSMQQRLQRDQRATDRDES
jgi:signal transduction histidine kinase